MKTLKLVVLGIVLFFAGATQGQISVHFNSGSPPAWGPVGYSDVRYYYLPDVQAYYDVQSSMFIYYEGQSWIRRSYLPSRYRDYDLYNGYKVVMRDYRGNTPYTHYYEHRKLYSKGYKGEPQKTIGERPGKSKNGSKDYRESNQVNRGRYGNENQNVRYDRSNDDKNYDKHGNSKSDDHGRSKGNNKAYNKEKKK